jgi:hypothetical protein
MSGIRNHGPLLPPHLGDEQLMAYLDGELPRAEMQSSRAHIDSCWTCRGRLSALHGRIEAFLDTQAALQTDTSPERDQRIRQFRERLAHHAVEIESQLTFADRIRGYAGSVIDALAHHRRAALAALVAACVLVAMFTDVWNTKVSADTVLARAADYEAASQPRPGKVVRIAIRVERIHRASGGTVQLGEITTLEDSLTPAESVSVQTASGAQRVITVADPADLDGIQPALALIDSELPRSLAAYLATQHWPMNFSVVSFGRLIAARGSSAATANRQGNVFALHFPFAPNHESGISQIQLLVEARNYAPVGLSLFTAASGEEYRFTRETLTMEPRTTELARLFGAPDVPERVRTHAAPRIPKLAPLTYEISRASIEEVHLATALHKADACLGEEIRIFPMSDGSLLVQGLVETTERRDQIHEALRAVDPVLRTQIYLPRELKSGSQLFRSPFKALEFHSGQPLTSGATLADLSSQRMPMYHELYQHFSKPGVSPEDTEKQINAFSNEAVTLARQTFLHAWALKKLDDEFSERRTLGLPAASLAEIEHMRQDHRQWIASLSHRQSSMLSQVMQAPPSGLAADPRSSAAQDADSLIRLAQEQNELVHALFTVSSNPAETEPTLARLLLVLHRMGA